MSLFYHLMPVVLLVWLASFLILLQVIGSPAEYVSEEVALQRQAGDSLTRGDRRLRELTFEARRRRSLACRWKACPAARTTDQRESGT